MKKNDKHLGKYMVAHWQLYVMIALPLILLIIFSYVPMYSCIVFELRKECEVQKDSADD